MVAVAMVAAKPRESCHKGLDKLSGENHSRSLSRVHFQKIPRHGGEEHQWKCVEIDEIIQCIDECTPVAARQL